VACADIGGFSAAREANEARYVFLVSRADCLCPQREAISFAVCSHDEACLERPVAPGSALASNKEPQARSFRPLPRSEVIIVKTLTVHGGISAWVQLISLRIVAVGAAAAHTRGMQKITWKLSRVPGFKAGNCVDLDTGLSVLRIYLDDGYWTRVLVPGYRYEPEVARLLQAVLGPTTYFLDCGANIGYWSAAAARFIGDGARVLAVEASPRVYDRLVENARLGGPRFQHKLAAVWSCDDEQLTIVSHLLRHAGSSVVDRKGRVGEHGYEASVIQTVTLERLVAQHCPERSATVVVKLDVEGAEIPALQGAARLFDERDVLLVYEDHGRDADARVSQHVSQRLGLRIFSLTAADVEQVGLSEVVAMKSNKSAGYNLAACRPGSEFERLLTRR
jgi:FkbM family methyltransferase